jgi:hypothetical protein
MRKRDTFCSRRRRIDEPQNGQKISFFAFGATGEPLFKVSLHLFIKGIHGGKNHENQFFKFRFSGRSNRRRFVDGLLAAGLDDAGSDDEYDRQYDAHGYEPIRLDALADGFCLGTHCVECFRRSFHVASGDRLQLVKQKYKGIKVTWR